MVLLPDPFGPRQPNTSPGRSVNDKSLTAGIDEYLLLSCTASSMETTSEAKWSGRQSESPRKRREPTCLDTVSYGYVSQKRRFGEIYLTGVFGLARYHLCVFSRCYMCCACTLIALFGTSVAQKNPSRPTSAPDTTLAHLITEIQVRTKKLEGSSGMRSSFQFFTSAYKIPPQSLRYGDFVIVRLFYEATRDAGFWNMRWSITNMPPNSDQLWRQWKDIPAVSPTKFTATAECDDLSALYAFLVERSGVHTIGLFWPYPNHTVAVWVIRPEHGSEVRVVVPTSQIFLDVTDSFGTKKFNPWSSEDHLRVPPTRRA